MLPRKLPVALTLKCELTPIYLSFARFSTVLALLFVSAFSGCSHYRPTESGYLTDYSQLRRDPFHLNFGIGTQVADSRPSTPEALHSIDSFYIEPAAWLVDPRSRAGKATSVREPLLARLDEELREQLGQIKPIVETPGPNSARVRSAITTVRLSRPLVNLGLTATLFSPIPIGPIFFGGGAIEAEALSPDGHQMAAVSTASSGGLIDFVGYYWKSGHARKSLHRNVKELKEALSP